MKKIITALFLAFLSTSFSFASEEVTLDISSINTLKAPKNPYIEMGTVDYEGNLVTDSKIDYYEYRDENESAFESKAGQTFEKFINRAVVDKKPEDFLKAPLKRQGLIKF
jgi:hypothetical protein